MSNILRGCAAERCHRTFTHEHGGALPDGPFPGTMGSQGDVRRCEHGKVWIFVGCEAYTIDVWREVSRFWEPITYARAVRAMGGAS